MHVIGHQHKGVNRATVPRSTLSQPGEVGAVIVIAKKDRLPIVSSLNHVRGHIRQVEPGFPGHANILVPLVRQIR
jgi:hypothetical protein